MKVVRDTGLLGRRKLLETLRRPVWVIVGLSTPLSTVKFVILPADRARAAWAA
jgi:hypothetical protein